MQCHSVENQIICNLYNWWTWIKPLCRRLVHRNSLLSDVIKFCQFTNIISVLTLVINCSLLHVSWFWHSSCVIYYFLNTVELCIQLMIVFIIWITPLIFSIIGWSRIAITNLMCIHHTESLVDSCYLIESFGAFVLFSLDLFGTLEFVYCKSNRLNPIYYKLDDNQCQSVPFFLILALLLHFPYLRQNEYLYTNV